MHIGAWMIALAAMATVLAETRAEARPRRRPFEPTDLDLEDPGTVELDAQLGYARGPQVGRLVAPDFELDVGLLRNLELDVDGALAWEGTAGGPGTPDHAVADNLWIAVKFGLDGVHDEDEGTTWALGAQLGPKLPLAPGAGGVGAEGLLLFHHAWRALELTLNVGGFVEPAQGGSRPHGVQGGVDLELPVTERWSALGALGGTWFASADPDQTTAALGAAWKPSATFALSLVALAGLLDGSDRWAVLGGASFKATLIAR